MGMRTMTRGRTQGLGMIVPCTSQKRKALMLEVECLILWLRLGEPPPGSGELGLKCGPFESAQGVVAARRLGSGVSSAAGAHPVSPVRAGEAEP